MLQTKINLKDIKKASLTYPNKILNMKVIIITKEYLYRLYKTLLNGILNIIISKMLNVKITSNI